MTNLLFPKFKSSAGLQAGLYYARKRSRLARIAAEGDSGPVNPPTVWNPADKAPEITLSNGNRTATGTNHVNGYAVRGTTSHSTGKRYIEFQNLVVDPIQTDDYVGLATAAESTEASGFSSPAQITYLSAGNSFSITAFSFTTGLPPYSGGHTVCMAIDFDNNLEWVRVDNGKWNNNVTSQDPALGASTINRTISGSAWFPFASLRTVGDAATVAGTAADLQFTPPAGFTPWDD
jgi:hypothetical protein